MIRRLAAAFAATTLAMTTCLACKSLPDDPPFEAADLAGVVCDRDGYPISGVSVRLDGEDAATTDGAGRFSIPRVTHGSHEISLAAEGCETVSLDFVFDRRTDIFWAQLLRAEDLLDMAIDAVAARELGDGASLLARSESVGAPDDLLGLVRALLFIANGSLEEAQATLSILSASTSSCSDAARHLQLIVAGRMDVRRARTVEETGS